jgi:hypothetical protein
MRYYAIPKNINKHYMLMADNYDEIMELALSAINKDPSIKEYEIVSFVSKVKINIDVTIEGVEFDPLPNIKKPNDGFVYFGCKPIYENDDDLPRSEDISLYLNGSWSCGCYGADLNSHYAVRIGSKAHQDATEAHKKGSAILWTNNEE